MSIEHWMIFGTFAEQRHFEYPTKGTYDGVVINANMAAHAPAGLAAFLIERTAGVKYVIDPLTHAFQHNRDAILNKEGEPRSSIKRLADWYGEPVASRVGRMPVSPGHFEDDGLLRDFVQRCLDFQASQLKRQMEESKAAKYLDGDEEFHPYALIAPYFYLTESTLDEWLPQNVRAAKLACDLNDRSHSRRFASVVVSQGVVTSGTSREKLIRAYADIDLDGFLLWVDALDEQHASSAELRGLVEVARGLRKQDTREVINLHGGYFSILAGGALGEGAMSGVAHGPEFGEHREVVPVGGGIPIARYYIPDLHLRVRYRDALRMFSSAGWLASAAQFHKQVCDCDKCKDVVAGDPANFQLFGKGTVKSVRRRHGVVRIEFATMETKLRCLCHYLQRKRREYLAADSLSRDALLQNLRNGVVKFEEVGGLDAVAHLRLWEMVLAPSNEA